MDIPPISSGTWYRLTNISLPDVCLDVINNGRSHIDGWLQMAPIGNYSGQHWQIIPTLEGAYRLRTQYTGPEMFLDVRDNGNDDPHLIDTRQSPQQQWRFVPNGNESFRLINEASGPELFFGAHVDESWSRARKLWMRPTDASDQIWKITPIGPILIPAFVMHEVKYW
jgi:hypothetical protein